MLSRKDRAYMHMENYTIGPPGRQNWVKPTEEFIMKPPTCKHEWEVAAAVKMARKIQTYG